MKGERGAGHECTACLPAYEGDWWGDGCEEPCGDFRTLDMAGRDDAEMYGLGNCDGCTFQGECKSCIEGHWGQKCQKECPKNCRNTKTGAWECNEWGGCFGCKVGFCRLIAKEGEEGGCDTQCSPTCRDSGKCSPGSCKCDGCAEGYYGHTCDKKCKEGCKLCKQASGACTECMTTHFAANGNVRNCKRCPANCKGDTCDKDGKCHLGCKEDKFHGETCEEKCPANCDGGVCKQEGTCQCAPGFFGKDCKGSCPEGCVTDECSEIGECDCKENFFGLVCDSAFCKGECDKPCPENCGEQCDRQYGTCECKHGFWGGKCENKCPEHCKSGGCDEDGNCDEGCDLGFWTHTCEEECDVGCLGKSCQQFDGWCECEPGKFGVSEEVDGKRSPACTDSCPHCLNPSTKSDVVCNQVTGRCSECPSAPTAKWGMMCEKDCPANCEDHCDWETGSCQCKIGHWGANCEACPAKCANMCDDEGKCVDGCEQGSWGETCEEHCSAHCRGNLCEKTAGECVRGCETGWWGLTCPEENACPPNTAEGVGCDIETGHSNSCKTGFHGDTCEKDCPPNCKEGCLKQTGTCKSCVENKWYDAKCESRCSANCHDGECDMKGDCFSCAKDAKMQFLRWGQNCENECASSCVDGCDSKTGKCNKCTPGSWHGKSGFCDEECDVSCGTCTGPSEDDCASCDYAASLQHVGKARKCVCVEPFAKVWKQADQVVPMNSPAGHTLRRAGKCTCEWREEDGITQKFLFGAGSGAGKYCAPGSPRGTIEGNGLVYPTGILFTSGGGWAQGRCKADELEVVPDKPFCVHMVAAVEMYKSERIGADILPPAKEWDASRVCSVWSDVTDDECRKGDAGVNVRTRDNDVKCGLLIDSFCMPKEDWDHITASSGHQVRGSDGGQIFV